MRPRQTIKATNMHIGVIGPPGIFGDPHSSGLLCASGIVFLFAMFKGDIFLGPFLILTLLTAGYYTAILGVVLILIWSMLIIKKLLGYL